MSEAFNAYQTWLGLDPRVGHPDYYQLLGVRREETDTARIAVVADRALARVRSFRPGPHAAAWAGLLEEIAAAKRCLTDPRLRAAYDGQPASGGPTTARPRPAPRSRPRPRTQTNPSGTPPAADPARDPALAHVPRVPMQAAQPADARPAAKRPAVPSLPRSPSPAAAAPVIPRSRRPRRARKANRLTLIAGLTGTGLLIMAAGLLVFLVAQRNSPDSTPTQPPAALAPTDRTNHTPPPTRTPRRVNRTSVAAVEEPEPEATNGRDAPPPGTHDPLDTAPSLTVPEPADLSPPESDAGSGSADEPVPAEGLGPGEAPETVAGPDQTADEATGPSSQDAPDSPAPAEAADREPADAVPVDPLPEPAGELSETLATEQIAAFQETLAAARTALQNRQVSSALQLLTPLQVAQRNRRSDDQYQRLQLLADYAAEFDNALSDALATFQGGDEIQVGPHEVVAVVRSLPHQLTLRVRGNNRTYATDQLPTGLAMAIVEQWLDDEDPVSWVIKAAFLATQEDPTGDLHRRARQWFQQAAGQGVEIGDLADVLDDRYDGGQ